MKVNELRERATEELVTLVAQLEDDLFKLRLQRTTNQLENTAAIRGKRRDIARAQTVMSARRLGREQQQAVRGEPGSGTSRDKQEEK